MYLAEALANVSWTRVELAPTAEDLHAQLIASARSVDMPLPAAVTVDAVAEVRARLLELRDRWRALVPHGALRFDLAGGRLAEPCPAAIGEG